MRLCVQYGKSIRTTHGPHAFLRARLLSCAGSFIHNCIELGVVVVVVAIDDSNVVVVVVVVSCVC